MSDGVPLCGFVVVFSLSRYAFTALAVCLGSLPC